MAGAAPLPRGRAVSTLAACDRGQRSAQQAQARRPSGGPGAARAGSGDRGGRGGRDGPRGARAPAADRRHAARGGPLGHRLPLLPRPQRARDSGGARDPPRNREVASGAGAGPPARADGGGGMTLEQMLRVAALDAEWPSTPDLEAAVVPRIGGVTPRQTGDAPLPERIRAQRPARRRRIRFGRPLAIALAALLL